MPVFYVIAAFLVFKYVLKGVLTPFTGAAQGLGLADTEEEKKALATYAQ